MALLPQSSGARFLLGATSAGAIATTPSIAKEPIAYNLKTETWGAPIPLTGGDARTPGRFIWGRSSQSLAGRRYFDSTGAEQVSATEFEWNGVCDVAVSFGYRTSATNLVALYFNGVQVDLRLLTYAWYNSQQLNADPTIIADKGVARAMAFKGQAYIVIRNLDLTKFGNSLPAISAIMEAASGSLTLATSITDRATALAQISADSFEFDGMDEAVIGYCAWEEAELRDHLVNDGALKGFEHWESGAAIKCKKIVSDTDYTIDRVLTARDLLPIDQAGTLVTRGAEEDAPYVVICNYIDWTVEFKTSFQRARRLRPNGQPQALDSRATAEFTSCLIMQASEALEAATRALFNMEAARVQVRFRVTRSNLDIEPADVLQLPAIDGVVLVVKVMETTFEPDRTTSCAGVVLFTADDYALEGEAGTADGVTSDTAAAGRWLTEDGGEWLTEDGGYWLTEGAE
jgi:hypothetical protein